jgi:hypothetical protein
MRSVKSSSCRQARARATLDRESCIASFSMAERDPSLNIWQPTVGSSSDDRFSTHAHFKREAARRGPSGPPDLLSSDVVDQRVEIADQPVVATGAAGHEIVEHKDRARSKTGWSTIPLICPWLYHCWRPMGTDSTTTGHCQACPITSAVKLLRQPSEFEPRPPRPLVVEQLQSY